MLANWSINDDFKQYWPWLATASFSTEHAQLLSNKSFALKFRARVELLPTALKGRVETATAEATRSGRGHWRVRDFVSVEVEGVIDDMLIIAFIATVPGAAASASAIILNASSSNGV